MKSLKERVIENYKSLGTKEGLARYVLPGGLSGFLIGKMRRNPKAGVIAGVVYTGVLPAFDALMEYGKDKLMAQYEQKQDGGCKCDSGYDCGPDCKCDDDCGCDCK